ncbi:phosphotransferase family protein [Inquilinus limosus]|uniref:Aminoglycoside phosphotransferase n=1 Tax=Inquilinus limosus MP06 TaxID=1398085 RepID=A0A0A0D9Y9_9PROT|nr:aminoglycoside phosphotransferase family protein [Inquilinus limosus]KGM34924.1 aminoglycoside phosphotransferase [Inquilinus limosus MP06]
MADPELLAALRRMGLAGPEETPRFTALTGGVSSDIFRVDLAAGPICVKRALAKLRVAADWRAPVARNLYEARWMRAAAAIVPQAVPRLLGQDEAAGTLAMAYLAPQDHPVWKAELRDGRADPAFAAEVGRRLVAIHAATAADPALAAEFPTDAIFYDIRLEPYLVATAIAHPDCAAALHALVETTRTAKRALVHGDVSPKNILVGPDGPVFLDAECAWWGDPAFDLAFCLNHLLLKGLWRPESAPDFLTCFDALSETYLADVDWEPSDAFESRAARLLPGLFLARVDGKSPVEYLTDAAQKGCVRRVARALLLDPPETLAEIGAAWARELGR